MMQYVTEKEQKKTPLYETHLKYGAHMMDFAGYCLPERFPEGSIREHLAVRKACGLFDTCHMPEFICRGKEALQAINYLFTNSYSDLRIGSARYGLMCDEEGGILDDLIVHRLTEDVYLVPVNAACREADFAWILDHSGRRFDAEWTDISDEIGTLALQGPLSERVLGKLAGPEAIPRGRFRFQWPAEIRDIPALIARTGYSGEDGFEIYVPAGRIAELWEQLNEAGREDGLQLCGLASRDTLRIEAGMPLYGKDLDRTVSPVEAGLDYGLNLQSGPFIGREAILERLENPAVRRVGLKPAEGRIIRGGQDIYINNIKIGRVTSGTYCAYVEAPLGMGYIETGFAKPGTTVLVDVRGKAVETVVTELPFYVPPYKRRDRV